MSAPASSRLAGKVALVTGAGARIGASIARALHAEGCDLALHHRRSRDAAERLRAELDSARPGSVLPLCFELGDCAALEAAIADIATWRERLDLLVNNASSFFPTPLEQARPEHWDALLDANLKGPFFLACAAAPLLRASHGCIVNLVDIHAERPLAGHAIYCIAKAGNAMMVKTLARELGPEVRVNGIAPGAILWPESGLSATAKDAILARTALRRVGEPEDIVRALRFLVLDAPYVTGHILAVDGGRSVQQ